MGLKSFLDNIIPNELKGNLGTVIGLGTAGYFGYRYAPDIYNYAKDFVGTKGSDAYWGKGGKEILLNPLVC